MSSETLHEPAEVIGPAVIDRHRAIVSLMEELEAVDWYDQRVDATDDAVAGRRPRPQPGRGEGARGDDARVAAPPRPVARPAPAHLPVHRRAGHRDRGRRRARRRRRRPVAAGRRLARHRQPEGTELDEPPAPRAGADLRGRPGRRSRTRPSPRLTTYLAARKLVDFEGPHGWTHSATNLGRVEAIAGPAAGSRPGSARCCRWSSCGPPFTRVPGRARRRRPRRRATSTSSEPGRGRRAASPRGRERGRVPRLRRRPGCAGITEASSHDPIALPADFEQLPDHGRQGRQRAARGRHRRSLRARPRPDRLHRRHRDAPSTAATCCSTTSARSWTARSCGRRASTARSCSACAAATSSFDSGQDLSIGYLSHDADDRAAVPRGELQLPRDRARRRRGAASGGRRSEAQRPLALTRRDRRSARAPRPSLAVFRTVIGDEIPRLRGDQDRELGPRWASAGTSRYSSRTVLGTRPREDTAASSVRYA